MTALQTHQHSYIFTATELRTT